MGFELAKILYLAGATIYIGARSSARCDGAKKGILSSTRTKGQSPKEGSLGKLENMVMDLADLASVKAAVGMFLAKEQRLDLLMHNAGVMTPPKGSVDEFVRLSPFPFPPIYFSNKKLTTTRKRDATLSSQPTVSAPSSSPPSSPPSYPAPPPRRPKTPCASCSSQACCTPVRRRR